MSLIELKIANWEKFNPRSDRTITIWFRLDNSFFHDQKLWSLTDGARLTYLFLLCEASKIQNCVIKVNLEMVAMLRKSTRAKIIQEIKELEELGVVHPPTGGQNPPLGGRTPDEIPATRQDTTQQDTTNKHSSANASDRARLGDIWNEGIRECPKSRGWPENRDRLAKSFLATRDESAWREIIGKINDSDFLAGRSGKWRASIDWALKASNATKVLEGNYDNNRGASVASISDILAEQGAAR